VRERSELILGDLIRLRAEKIPERDVLTFEHLSLDGERTPDEVRTYAELSLHADRIAAASWDSVIFDLPGRDAVVDFLARDGDVHRVYESEGADSLVHDHSAAADLQPDGGAYRLTAPVTAGFMVVRLLDPHAGRMAIQAVTRADGKRITGGYERDGTRTGTFTLTRVGAVKMLSSEGPTPNEKAAERVREELLRRLEEGSLPGEDVP